MLAPPKMSSVYAAVAEKRVNRKIGAAIDTNGYSNAVTSTFDPFAPQSKTGNRGLKKHEIVACEVAARKAKYEANKVGFMDPRVKREREAARAAAEARAAEERARKEAERAQYARENKSSLAALVSIRDKTPMAAAAVAAPTATVPDAWDD